MPISNNSQPQDPNDVVLVHIEPVGGYAHTYEVSLRALARDKSVADGIERLPAHPARLKGCLLALERLIYAEAVETARDKKPRALPVMDHDHKPMSVQILYH